MGRYLMLLFAIYLIYIIYFIYLSPTTTRNPKNG